MKPYFHVINEKNMQFLFIVPFLGWSNEIAKENLENWKMSKTTKK